MKEEKENNRKKSTKARVDFFEKVKKLTNT